MIALMLGTYITINPDWYTTAQAAITTPVNQNQVAIDQKADDIVNTAMSLIGQATYNRYEYKPTAPYKFGCSGFIYYAFLQNGIDINTRNTQFQANLGEYVPKDQLQKGDLVFFDSSPDDADPVTHDGIYIGDNKIIHMADSINNVVISDLDSKAYYRDYYKMARRLIPSYMPSVNPSIGEKIVNTAESLVGKVQYGTYNENTLTFNNTGFDSYVYKMNGIDLGTQSLSQQSNLGQYVPKDQLQKGDLVFFSNDSSNGEIRLVGIYAGNNNVIINASSSTGVVKRYMETYFYENNYVTARRVASSSTPTVDEGNKIVNMAEDLVGKVNYGSSYNESTLTFNSAGFMYYIHNKNEIDLKTKDASEQAKLGSLVSKEQLQIGDLVFFSRSPGSERVSLVGLYSGNGNVIINAGTSTGVVERSLQRDYYQKRYVTARRIQ
ncbi:MAG: C40 family peptidase [Clostridium sp.]